MLNMTASTGTSWAAISILAHEVGHHLNGHTLEATGSRPPSELEADKFSGFVLQKLGSNLGNATAAMKAFGSEQGSTTHPAKAERLAAITAGWLQACDSDSKCDGPDYERKIEKGTSIQPQTQTQTQPQPVAWTDECNIQGEMVRIRANGQVVSTSTNQIVGQKAASFWPQNCIFDLTRGDGGRYCVQQTGDVFYGTPQPVGFCRALN